MKTSSRWSRVLVFWLIAASVFAFLAPALFAQGTVQFSNTATTQLTTNGPFGPGVTTGAGQFTIGLYIAPAGTTDPYAFVLMGPTTLSQSGLGNGRFNGNPLPNNFVISNNTGQAIAFQVRAWSTFAGATFEAAVSRSDLPNRYLGTSTIGQVTPAMNLTPTPALFGTSAGQVGGITLFPGPYNPDPNFPPIVSITNLTNGALFAAPGIVPVRVSATDIDGFVTSVYLFTNNAFAAQMTPPYNITLTNLAPGYYTLRAEAVDNESSFTYSTPVTVRVASRPVVAFARGSNGPIQFQFNSATGINYVVESGILTNFSPVITNAGTASPISYSETNGSATQRTYRVRLQ